MHKVSPFGYLKKIYAILEHNTFPAFIFLTFKSFLKV